MKHNRWFSTVALLMIATMVLTACAPSAAQGGAPTSQPITTQAPSQATTPTTAATSGAASTPTTAATSASTTATTPSATQASGKNTIIIGTTDTIASLDPADAYATRDWELIQNISEGLLVYKPGTLTLEPGLATDMGQVSSDGLTYTFTLKDGIKFGDGTPLDATVYAQQLNRLLTIGPKCPNDVADSLAVPFVKSITAPDAKTIVFTLKAPIAYFKGILASSPYVASDP